MPVIARLRRSSRQRPRRRRRLRTISTLPTLLTLANLLCGFAAVHFCLRAISGPGQVIPRLVGPATFNQLQERLLPSFLAIGAAFIFLGLIWDALDGSIARLTNRTTDFGGQLDSLADVVTFGVAPAILIIAVLQAQPEMAGLTGPLSGDLMGRAMWVMVAFYVACAALRLARFNVEHAETGATHTRFSGLPSPGAATVIAALILLHEHLEVSARVYLADALPFVALGLGLLMVSRIRYIHLANTYLRGRRPFGQVVALVVLLAVFWWYKELTLAVVVCAYALSGPVGAVVQRLRRGRQPAVAATDAAQQTHHRAEPPAAVRDRSA
jgi:CDP-diacylglycerol--serine O-phosphatidyltransferase